MINNLKIIIKITNYKVSSKYHFLYRKYCMNNLIYILQRVCKISDEQESKKIMEVFYSIVLASPPFTNTHAHTYICVHINLN